MSTQNRPQCSVHVSYCVNVDIRLSPFNCFCINITLFVAKSSSSYNGNGSHIFFLIELQKAHIIYGKIALLFCLYFEWVHMSLGFYCVFFSAYKTKSFSLLLVPRKQLSHLFATRPNNLHFIYTHIFGIAKFIKR